MSGSNKARIRDYGIVVGVLLTREHNTITNVRRTSGAGQGDINSNDWFATVDEQQ